jgi:hypothetical protein
MNRRQEERIFLSCYRQKRKTFVQTNPRALCGSTHQDEEGQPQHRLQRHLRTLLANGSIASFTPFLFMSTSIGYSTTTPQLLVIQPGTTDGQSPTASVFPAPLGERPANGSPRINAHDTRLCESNSLQLISVPSRRRLSFDDDCVGPCPFRAEEIHAVINKKTPIRTLRFSIDCARISHCFSRPQWSG